MQSRMRPDVIWLFDSPPHEIAKREGLDIQLEEFQKNIVSRC